MRRGEVWSYAPRQSPRRQVVAVVSSDGINQSPRPWLIGAPILADDPRDILAVPVGEFGWVNAGNLARYYREWFQEQLSVLDRQTVEDLDTALRAALDL